MFKNILFDLDGTLNDSGLGITNSVKYALEKSGVSKEEIEKQNLNLFIGPPLRSSFQLFFNFSDEQADAAVAYYREYFNEEGINQNEFYPGIPEMLSTLFENNYNLYVATSKPTFFAKKILEQKKLTRFFKDIIGSPMDLKGLSKSDIIKNVLAENELTPEDCIMVGDREYDIFGAHENGMQAVGVLYGYGDLAELTAVKADYIIKDVPELTTLLLSL